MDEAKAELKDALPAVTENLSPVPIQTSTALKEAASIQLEGEGKASSQQWKEELKKEELKQQRVCGTQQNGRVFQE